MAGKIFVNYRRKDAGAHALNIRERLAKAFRARNVFMDVDDLKPGQRFDHELAEALRQCAVFLVVIGPSWLALLKERAKEDGRDYVREEIAAALSLGIVVMPVLIDRTPLPPADQLPDDIRALVMHQTLDLARFGRDMSELIKVINSVRRRLLIGAIKSRWRRLRSLLTEAIKSLWRLRRALPWRTFAVACVAAVSVALAVLIYRVVTPQVEGQAAVGIEKPPDSHVTVAKREEDRTLQEKVMRAVEAKRREDEQRGWEIALAAEIRRVEQAKNTQEAKRLENERAELLARNEGLREALDAARMAREATKAAEQKWVAALKPAEGATKDAEGTIPKQQDAEKTSDPAKFAALPKPEKAQSANPFDGTWQIVRHGHRCGNNRFTTILVIGNGTIIASMGAGGVRGSVSSSGEFRLTHVSSTPNRGGHAGTHSYSGTLRGNSGSGTFFHSHGPCSGTFTLTRRAVR